MNAADRISGVANRAASNTGGEVIIHKLITTGITPLKLFVNQKKRIQKIKTNEIIETKTGALVNGTPALYEKYESTI